MTRNHNRLFHPFVLPEHLYYFSDIFLCFCVAVDGEDVVRMRGSHFETRVDPSTRHSGCTHLGLHPKPLPLAHPLRTHDTHTKHRRLVARFARVPVPKTFKTCDMLWDVRSGDHESDALESRTDGGGRSGGVQREQGLEVGEAVGKNSK